MRRCASAKRKSPQRERVDLSFLLSTIICELTNKVGRAICRGFGRGFDRAIVKFLTKSNFLSLYNVYNILYTIFRVQIVSNFKKMYPKSLFVN